MGVGERTETVLVDLARIGLADDPSGNTALWENLDLTDVDDRRFGDYDLLELIGRGGMGVVFRATQLSLGREVAVKFIIAGLADDPSAVQRFCSEARAAARLHHPNIVPVLEVGAVDGMHFFSMPLLRGQTLAQRLSTKPMSQAESVALLLKLAAAVDYAHSLALLHLDLKPANVLFDEHDQPLVSDFGLARHMDESGVVNATDVSGTPGYMAPEQGELGTHRLGRRTDVYALGSILLELLTRADNGSNALDQDLAAICKKCLQLEPDGRYQRVADLAADLTRYRDGNSVSVRKLSWNERMSRSMRRHPALSLAIAATFAAMVVGLATTSWQWRRADLALAEAARQQSLTRAQALRTEQLAGLMAAAFPADKGSNYEDRVGSARNAVAWLKNNVAGDPVAQRGVLTAFRQALSEAKKDEAVDMLMHEIVDQLGEDYRQQQVRRLAASGTRDSLIAAGLIGIARGDGSPSLAYEATLLRLFNEHPDDELALYVAALSCHVQPAPCTHPEFYRHLVSKFPDNVVHWLLIPRGMNPTDDELGSMVANAGKATGFDDRHATYYGIVLDAVRGQRIPASLREPIQAVLEEKEVVSYLQQHLSWSVPHPDFRDLTLTCKPKPRQPNSLREACGRLAILGMRSPKSSLVGRMVSGGIVRRLYKGTRLEAEAKEMRRQYVWLGDHAAESPREDELLQRDTAEFGEWEAWQRRTERFGFSRFPPVGWLPEDPQKLLLHEERTPIQPAR